MHASESTKIPKTMFGALYEEGHSDTVIRKDHHVPSPGKGEVLIKVSGTGVCHSDVLILSGVSFDTRSYILGHEICGVPVLLGQGVDPKSAKIGKLYTIYDVSSCARGTQASGGFALNNTTGLGLDGGYADYVVVKVDQLVPVPKGVSILDAAIAADAGTTAHHAVHHTAGIKPGTNYKVLIFGAGGLGHLGVQYAKHYGATVYVCDIKPEARKLAQDLIGHTGSEKRVFDMIELQTAITNGFVPDITIDFAADTATYNLALAALKGKGATFPEVAKMVVVGVSLDTIPVNSFELVASTIHILGTAYGSREDTKMVLDLFASGAVKGHVSAVDLKKIQTVLDELRAGEVTGRKVVMPDLDLLKTYVYQD